MAEVTLKCPSCEKDVTLGDIECPHCGMNLKSGEAFETRVKKAKGKEKHPEHFGRGIYFGVVVAFSLVIFAGFMYQGLVEETIQQKRELFEYAVLKLQEIDDLVVAGKHEWAQGNPAAAQGKYDEAREATQELITWIDGEAARIKPEQPYAKKHTESWRRLEPEYNRRVAKRLLYNLKAKAQYTLEQIPLS